MLKINFKKLLRNCQCKLITTLFVALRINLIIWQKNITSNMPRYVLGMCSVGIWNSYAKPGSYKSLVTH